MKTNATILIVDDNEDILIAGDLLLKRHFSTVITCNLPDNIPHLMAEQSIDVVLLDMNFGPGESTGKQGYLWLEKILDINPQTVVIMITAHGGVKVAVEAMKRGASDFIAKPWQNEKVIATVSTAIQLSKSRQETNELKSANKILAQVSASHNNQRLLGNSSGMATVLSLIERSAPTDANILILGENGTGKELVARELHAQSLRSDNVFMAIDLGAISESLFESELFGHQKGAFTGARENRVGLLKAASGGTLFLDEIGNLPLHLQAKLLTVLERRTVTPLGANTASPFDVRVITATNISKQDLADESKFRQDLLFRLNTVEISLPPLRKRTTDIAMLADHYINFYCQKYGKNETLLSAKALESICNYSWPGNIRALRHAIERAIILSQHALLEPSDFQLTDYGKQSGDLSSYESNIAEQDSQQNALQASSDLNLARVEKITIQQALQKHHYNISHSAKELGLTRAALYRRMEKYGF